MIKTMTEENNETRTGFRRFDLAVPLNRGLAEARFESVRPIQAKTLPAALGGRDVLGLAQTGTGKTAAFALPILQSLACKQQRGSAPCALIVAPTRELAQQIETEIRLLGRYVRARTTTIFGGVSAKPQIDALRRGVDILIACPGRLMDLVGQRELRLDRIETLVLDEADHMFDMGFLPDIRRILANLPKERQNLFFSATMPGEIRKLANAMLSRPVVVELGQRAPATTIDHGLFRVREQDKLLLLRRLFAAQSFRSAIVFTRTKHRAKRLALALERLGHRAIGLQGNMSQKKRDEAMEGFRQRRYQVLVATDIAARGIDVARVSHVVNFDVPVSPDAYTHRIGRTGRAGQSGKAYTLVTEADYRLIRAIERQIGKRIAKLDGTALPEAEQLPPAPTANDSRSAPRRSRSNPPRTAGPKRRRTRAKRGQASPQSHGGP